MELEDLLSNYVLGDGEIISIETNLNYQERNKSAATVDLIIRKSVDKKKFEKCRVKLKFEQVIEVSINEDFGSVYYSDVVLVKQENGSYYLSLDPYGNSGKPHEDDNLIIIANAFAIEEIK
ncbi:hypothetical protein H8S95_05885 [Pontibacter sp. KCTC 32443]|uniref:hypothetical protein n=1 Tax=Pontibacter TaxID=323449 RepID=UPI00164DA643|nr:MULTISPECIES: hypothetical protein [Pontibacter]MBC5773587.1 hypothetical protein [Pontibacter sp. KCTC 32443]